MKTSELTGAALNWAVGKCEGLSIESDWWDWDRLCFVDKFNVDFEPSCDWLQGGKIIEREGISICNLEANDWKVNGWTASVGELWSPNDDGWISPTPLIAAMRCYVASKLGDEVEVPEELLDCVYE